MAKFEVQFTVSVCVSKSIKAKNMDEALQSAKAMAMDDPIRQGLIKIPRSITYQYNNDTEVTGVFK